jgi:F0F1-type ATP synthase alpha subunit
MAVLSADAQSHATRKLSESLRLEYAQFLELEIFAAR